MTQERPKRTDRSSVRALLLALLAGNLAAAGSEPAPGDSVIANSGTQVPAAHGDWPLWRGSPQRTGLQGLAGRIRKPGVKWRLFLGGSVRAEETLLVKARGQVKEDLLFVNTGERLDAFSLDGSRAISRKLGTPMRLLAAADLDGDGTPEIVAASVGVSGGRIFVLSATSGKTLWTSAPCDGQAGAVKVFKRTGHEGAVLLWLPAASSRLTAFAFPRGAHHPCVLWETVIEDFVSDPYSFSDIAVGDLDGSGRQNIVVSGARNQILVIVFDAATGRETARRVHNGEVAGFESGGTQQLLKIVHRDGRTGGEVLGISSYDSRNGGMFRGAATYSPSNPTIDFVLDSFPTGLSFASGSVADFDGDGKVEALVSRFDPGISRHDLLLLDLPSLRVRWRLENFALAGIVETAPGRHWVFGYEDQDSEGRSGAGCFSAIEIIRGMVERRWSAGATLSLERMRRAGRMTDDTANTPPAPVVIPGAGDRRLLVVGRESADGTPDGAVDLLDISTGEAAAGFAARDGVQLSLLAANVTGEAASSRLVLAGNDGSLRFLDGRLTLIATARCGALRANALNGHSTERAVVAAGFSGARKTLFVRDSRERVLRLDRERREDGGWDVRGEAIWNQAVTQELVLFPGEDGFPAVAVRGYEENSPILAALGPDGRLLWKVRAGASKGVPRNESMPVGIGLGQDRITGRDRLVFASGTPSSNRLTLQAVDAASGKSLWHSREGTYWDGVVACWDVDGDGVDDAIVNWNSDKCFVVGGRTGQRLGKSTRLPPFRDLGNVDYNGVPIVAGERDGRTEIVNSEDDAHLAGLTLRGSSASGDSCEAEVRWSLEQARIDDERHSMSALAPDARRGWIVGTGSRRGVVTAVRGDTGEVIWRVALRNGKVGPENGGDTNENPLSSVLALDVNGDGRTEFVVGGSDGWLYAIDSGSGRLVWSLDLKAPVLDPIAADFDGVGSSEILVPTGDGWLYAIGGR